MTKKVERKPRKKSTKEIIVKTEVDESIVSSLVLNGDVSKMTPDQKAKYNIQLCKSLGLNPLVQPFQILELQGREVLYATKSATEQLRKAQGVSVISLDRKIENDICIVTAVVSDKSGRTDAATGAVNIKGMSGDMLANSIMKAETKAKRRATLSICGLGMLDESEIETIPGAIAVVTDSTSKEEIDVDAIYNRLIESMKSATNTMQLVKIKSDGIKHASLFSSEQKNELNFVYDARKKELSGE